MPRNTRGVLDFPTNYTCTTCSTSLVNRYDCWCSNEYGQCENTGASCRFYFCHSCGTEEKVSKNQIDLENEQRGKDLRMENGQKPLPDEQRHWSEKEKDVLTGMLKKIATPDAEWKSANELERQSAGTKSLWQAAKALTSSPLSGDGSA